MTKNAKNINLYLIDGDVKQRIKASIPNWTGLAYKIPRTAIESSAHIETLEQTGVYFLFGIDDSDDKDVVYIGQAGVRRNGRGLLGRIQEHKKDTNKDYWTEAIVFTTSNNSFGPTEITYLENRFHHIAQSTRRYEVKNENIPTPGNITEEKETELEEFMVNAKMLMGALGHNIFEPYIDNRAPVYDNTDEENPILLFNYRNIEAKGQRTSEGFVVFAGSKISRAITNSCSESAKRFRHRYDEQTNNDFVLTEDVLLSSPSAAAGFVGGANLSGNITWVNDAGMTLKDMEAH